MMFFLSDEMPFSFDELLLFGAASGGKAIEDTATGNPLVFVTDLARPLKSLLIPFTPKQEGTGDPSPSNIRPIVPWNGLTVEHGGKNLFDPQKSVVTQYNIQPYLNDPITLPAGKYVMSCSEQCNGLYVKEGETVLFTKYNSTYQAFTLTAEKEVTFNFYKSDGFSANATVQLEVGQTATSYESYKPVTETDIVFPALGKNLLDANQQNIMYQNVSPSHGSYEIVNRNALTVTRTDTTACAMLLKVFKITSAMVGKTFSFSGKLNGGNAGNPINDYRKASYSALSRHWCWLGFNAVWESVCGRPQTVS